MNVCIVDHGGVFPAVKYGGTKRVLWGLGKSLTEMGHKVTYIVPFGSECEFGDVIFLDKNVDLNTQIPEHIDFVHLNFFPLQPIKKPYLITVHGNLPESGPLDPNVVFISRNHAARYNAETFVYNGLYWEDYPEPDLNLERTRYHFLGKASWKVKNLIGAIRIADKSRIELDVIGGDRWTLRNMKRGLRFILNPKVHFHGTLDDKQKMKVMQHSKGLIFPVTWHEPFGLAIIESFYAGCSVFGTTQGSLPELVSKETGFLSNSTGAIIEAIAGYEHNPKWCHEIAVEKFHSRRMAKDYLKLYEKVLNGEKLNPNSHYDPLRNKVLPLT